MMVAASVIATTAMALSIAPAFAQTSAAKPASTTTPADASKLVRADRSMLGDLAEGNRAEVAAGRLALQKSQNAEVKKFAQMMIDDHGKALTEVEALAQSKDTKLPDGMGAMHKAKEVALKALSGQMFDSQYAKRAGVGDHESTVKLLKKIQSEAKDADLKALADKMLPTVEHHLEMAKQLVATK